MSNGNLTPTPIKMSLLLAMNKESMLTDPINWDLFKRMLVKSPVDSPLYLLGPPTSFAR
jgi:hypothetical protein